MTDQSQTVTRLSRRALLAAGASVFAPSIGRAQPRMRRIAMASPSHRVSDMAIGPNSEFTAFLQELRRRGHVEGSTLAIARFTGIGRGDPYASIAREVVAGDPEVIVARSTPLVAAIREVTRTIPIVAALNDPVASGLVESLARPGGNLTAFSTDAGPEMNAKHLQLMRDFVPRASRIGLLDVKAMWDLPGAAAVREGARRLNVTLLPFLLDHPVTPSSYDAAFVDIMRTRVDALLVGAAAENFANMEQIATQALRAELPSIYVDSRYARAGGLMSYGPDIRIVWRGLADYVDRILRGASPRDLPVQLPREFEFVVNVSTAERLGLGMPEAIRVFATEFVE